MTSQTVDIASFSSAYYFDNDDNLWGIWNGMYQYLQTTTSANGKLITRFRYDEMGRRIEVQEAKADNALGSRTPIRQTYYDVRGNIIRQDKDAHDITVTGAIVEFTYDALNRKLTETYTNRNLVDRQAWSYQNGQLRSYQDMAGSITAYRYDSAGRLANEYRADAALNQIAGQKNISYAYDIYGNVTEINDAGTSTMTRYAYDAAWCPEFLSVAASTVPAGTGARSD